MTKINPPLPKGHRRQETTTLAVYSATRDILKTLAERKNTSMMEYTRWLVDCAESGLVGPTPGAIPDSEACSLVAGLLDGQMTYVEGLGALNRLVFRACQVTRAALEAEWSGYNDRD